MDLYVNFSSFELPKNINKLKKKILTIKSFLKRNQIKNIEVSYPRIKKIENFFFNNFNDFNVIFNFNEILDIEELKNCIKVSQQYNSNIIRIKFSNYLEFKRDKKKIYEKKINNFIYILKGIKKYLKKNNFFIAIENHQDIDSNDFEKIFKNVKSNFVGICFDTANAVATCELPETYVKKFASKIFLVHIKNYKIFYKYNSFIQLNASSLQSGSLDITDLLNNIISKSQCKNFSIEIGNKKRRTININDNQIKKILNSRNKTKQYLFQKFIEKFDKPYNEKNFNVYYLIRSSLKMIRSNFNL